MGESDFKQSPKGNKVQYRDKMNIPRLFYTDISNLKKAHRNTNN